MIKKFDRIDGSYIEIIEGQSEYAFSLSDTTDFFDLIEYSEHGGYRGSTITFYNLDTGKVFEPFEVKRNVVYGKPRFINGLIYFLKVDYDDKIIMLYSFCDNAVKEEATLKLDLEKINLYNLNIIGEKLHIISQDEDFRCYYPKKFSFRLKPHESVIFIENDRIYCEEWVEEGWDDKSNSPTENYKCYDKIIVRDFNGNIVSEETGSLFKASNGIWWIS